VIKIKDGIKGRIKGEESIQVYTPTKMHPVQVCVVLCCGGVV
jgi:hypothetical protein